MHTSCSINSPGNPVWLHHSYHCCSTGCTIGIDLFKYFCVTRNDGLKTYRNKHCNMLNEFCQLNLISLVLPLFHSKIKSYCFLSFNSTRITPQSNLDFVHPYSYSRSMCTVLCLQWRIHDFPLRG